jgi:hypothetical protein
LTKVGLAAGDGAAATGLAWACADAQRSAAAATAIIVIAKKVLISRAILL